MNYIYYIRDFSIELLLCVEHVVIKLTQKECELKVD